MKKIFALAILAVAVLLLQGVAIAQTQFGTVAGTVTDPNGAAVPGARVLLTNIATDAKLESVTNDAGLYTIGNVPAARYQITVEKQGFKTLKQPATVEVAQRLTADFTLQIGEITDIVNVTEEVAPINTVSGELSRTITGREVLNLPLLTRNPYNLVGLAPGASDTGQVTGDTRGVGLAVAGNRTASINFMLDGGENNDTFTAGVGQTVPLDAIQEFKVQTNSMTAEFGRNAIIANVITKSGSNDVHGSLYEFYRGARFASNTFDDNANGTPKTNFVRNNFGGTIGGPIIKDKTFYFGSLEGLRVRSAGVKRYFVPTQAFLNNASTNAANFINAFGGLPAANDPVFLTAEQIVVGIEGAPSYAGNELVNAKTGTIIPGNTPLFQRISLRAPIDVGAGRPENTYSWTARLDHRFSNATSLFGRYAFYNELDFPGTVSISPYQGFNTGQRFRNQNLNLTLTHSFSPTFFSESRVIYNRVFNSQPFGSAPATTPCWNYDLNGNTPTGDKIVFPGYSPDVCSFAGIPFGGPQNIYQGFEGITKTVGKHTIKAGGQYLHLRDNRTFGAFENGFFDTFSMQGMLNGTVDFIAVAIDPRGKSVGETYDPTVDGPYQFPSFTRHFHYNEWATYIEDSYKFNRKLTVNLGLRYEYFGVLHSPSKERFLDANLYLNSVGTADPNKPITLQVRDARFRRTNQFYRPDYNNFAPRASFAYDLFGNGRTVLRAGYGIFYDRNFGNAVFNAIQNPPNYAVIQPDVSGSPLPIFPNQFNTINSLGAQAISSSARMLDNDLVTAYSEQWNVTLEHDLFGKGIITTFSYMGNNGIHLYSLNNLNQRGSCLLAPPGSEPCNPAGGRTSRLNQTGLTGMNRRGNEGLSRYKGFSFDVRTRRLGTSGLTLNGNYTWSHLRDNESSFFADAALESDFGFGFRFPFNPAADLADSTNDIRHRGTISGTWEVPFGRHLHGFAKQALDGWVFNGIFVAQTGGAFSVYDGGTSQCTLSGTNFCFPIITGPVPSRSNTPNPGVPNSFVLYNISNIFQTQLDFCGGDLGCTARLANGLAGSEKLEPRNLFRTPGYWNADASVFKNFALPWREGMALQLRGEFFNVFNHSNLYVTTDTNQFTGAGSQVLARRGVPPAFTFGLASKERRNVQLAVRLIF